MGRFFIYVVFILASFGLSHARPSADIDIAVQNAVNAALEAVIAAELDAPEASRIYAMTAVAIHDAYEISQERPGYMATATGRAETGALIKAASNAVLRHAFPEQNLTSPDTASKKLGAAIAADILDRFVKPAPTSFEEKGLWRIGDDTPLNPEWVGAPVMEISRASQFRPGGPPDIDTTAFTNALDETRLLGEDYSQQRLADASITARFWMDAPATYTPPGRWNYIAMETLGHKPAETKIDMLLALNIALYDAGIAAWDTKYHYRYWRPDVSVNAYYPHEEWKPMAESPLHPEYVSGHSTFSGAAATILTAYADDTPFCTVSKELWDLQRCFPSYQAAAEEAGMSRIYGGIHYRFSNEDGLKLGANVAKHVLKRLQDKRVIAKS